MANLRDARDALGRRGITVVAGSSVYETEPQAGAVGQDDFLNACVEVESDLDPPDLLAVVKRIEVELGRDPDAPRHSSRPIDIDVLIVEGTEIDEPHFRVPHADLENRRFVLVPLLELDPPDRSRLEAALARIEGQRVTPFGDL